MKPLLFIIFLVFVFNPFGQLYSDKKCDIALNGTGFNSCISYCVDHPNVFWDKSTANQLCNKKFQLSGVCSEYCAAECKTIKTQCLNQNQKKNGTIVENAKCIEGNCINGKGKIKLDNGIEVACNNFANGEFGGLCQTFDTDGTLTERFIKNGEHISKKVYHSNGTVCKYSLHAAKGKDNSEKVTCTTKGESTFDGYWLSGWGFHGDGELKFQNGAFYKGNFYHMTFHGEGTLILPDGSKYVGEWFEGKEHGKGTEFNSEGKIIYQGNWIQGKKEQPAEK